MSAPSTPIPSDVAVKAELSRRLARIEGQVRGVARMVDEDRACLDVLTQVSAIQAAFDKVSLAVLDAHAHQCLAGHRAARSEDIKDLMTAVDRMRRR